MQHPKEMQVVRFSMLVLFSALMVVYLLLYEIKGPQMINNSNLAVTGTAITTTGKISNISNLLLESNDQIKSGTTNNAIETTTANNSSLFGANTSGSTTGTKTTAIKLLSGTQSRYGLIESIEKLGISYQYALKDDQDIYYVYLGKNSKIDIQSIVKKLGGSIYSILRENEIIKNNLFGDKVIYINLPEYKNKKVIMLVTIDGSDWLLQIDYAKYYTSKSYLKTLFN